MTWRGYRLSDRLGTRDNNFDVLRMLAAVGVMVSHAFPIALGAGTPEPFETFLKGDNLGRACVFAFFVISGFFIMRSFMLKRNARVFLQARLLRLYPALIVMFALVIAASALAFVAGAPGTDSFWPSLPGAAVTWLTFVGYAQPEGLFAANPLPGAVNGSLWTLRYEVLCYLGVLGAGLAGIFDRKALFASLIGFFLICYFVGPQVTGRIVPLFLLYLGWPFLIGAAVFVWRDQIVLSLPIFAMLVLGLIALRPTPAFLPVFVVTLAYGLFLIGFARLPALALYNRLGDYSYGMYIYAFPIQQSAAAAGYVTPMSNLMVAAPLTLVCAVLSWHLIEAPALRMRKAV